MSGPRHRSPDKLLEVFWSRVTIADGDRCWVWQRGKNTGGYGVFSHRRRQIAAHRFAWELANGPIPVGLQVLHRCDNPACVRVGHLFVGTIADNMADKTTKGRQARGERNGGGGKLTACQAAAVKVASGTHREIAHHFGISHAMVGYIKRGSQWERT